MACGLKIAPQHCKVFQNGLNRGENKVIFSSVSIIGDIMRITTPQHLSELQRNSKNIRNICILAHVDHGEFEKL